MPKKFSKKPTIFFKNRVLAVVEKIPRGETMSYQKVAFLAGRPRAYRAVGNILNQNQNPDIPCHRVIKVDGRVGGYRKGANKKITLLKKEGVIIRTLARPRTLILASFELKRRRVCSFPKK